MIVLWVSRHAPPTKARQELQNLVGEYQLVWYKDSVKEVSDLLNSLGPQDRIVATLPLDFLDQLVRLVRAHGMLPVLRPVIRHRTPNNGTDRWEFMGFEEVLEARVVSRKVGAWT